MRHFRFALPALLLLLASCGGGDKATGPSNPTGTTTSSGNSMSASIDGVAWNASVAVQGLTVPPSGNVPRIVSVAGGSQTLAISFAFPAPSTGTYTTAGNPGTNFSVIETVGGKTWSALSASNGSSGTVTVTTLTATRAAGTFSFTAVASASSGATGTRVVTAGVFDVTF
jgi:hypothetical protein